VNPGGALSKKEEKMAKRKILIVDDEPDFVKMVRMRLEASGYDVISSLDGSEGVAMAEREKPDAILLDIMMPKKDGYTVFRELKAKPATKKIPVIVITAKPGMKDLFEMEGVDDYILKPFESEDLQFRVERVLKKKRITA